MIESPVLEIVRDKHRQCNKCGLRKGCKQVVPAYGSVFAKIMIVAEAPGSEEDIQGEPLVGRCGRFFDNMLSECGLKREDVFIANAVNCRPPNNRTPEAVELAACKVWLWQYMKLVSPPVIITFGRISTAMLLKIDWTYKHKMKDYLDKTFALDYFPATVIPCYHPSYYLRKPNNQTKQYFINAIQRAKELCNEAVQQK